MRTETMAPTNVVRFPGPRKKPNTESQQKGLLDTIYTSGALVVAADDRETKAMAARLQIFGFLNVAEVSTDGSLRRLRPSETALAKADKPWRLSRPSFDETPPLAG